MKSTLLFSLLLFLAPIGVIAQEFLWCERVVPHRRNSFAVSLVTDQQGNIYTCGIMPDHNDQIESDYVYVKKYAADGSLVWTETLGNQWGTPLGQYNTIGRDITLDGDGNVLVAGRDENVRMTLTRFDEAGNLLSLNMAEVQQTISDHSELMAVDVTTQNEILTVGNFCGSLVVYGVSDTVTYNTSSFGSRFFAKLDNDGRFLFFKPLLGTGGVDFERIHSDNLGNIFIQGVFSDTLDLDPSIDTHLVVSENTHSFLAKYDSNGNYLWSNTLPCEWNWYYNLLNRFGFALDEVGNTYATGKAKGTVDFDPGSGTALVDSADAYLVSYDSDGNFRWVKNWYGQPRNAVFHNQSVYVGGQYASDFNLNPNGNEVSSFDCYGNAGTTGSTTIIISESGVFQDAIAFEGEMIDLKVDVEGNLVSTGSFSEQTNFDPTGITFCRNASGPEPYLHKMTLPIVSVEELSETNNIRAYPNPTTGQVEIVFPFNQRPDFNLYDLTGKTLVNQVTVDYSNNRFQLDMSSLSAGLYVAEVGTKSILIAKN